MKLNQRKLRNSVLTLGLLVCLVDIFLQIYFRLVAFGVANYGISFGALKGVGQGIGIFVFGMFIVWMALRVFHKREVNVFLYLVALGGLGNAVGRLVIGNVWDYIYLPILPFWFNLSDSLISVGVIFYIAGILWSNGDTSVV